MVIVYMMTVWAVVVVGGKNTAADFQRSAADFRPWP
jgi:hypothetical protein